MRLLWVSVLAVLTNGRGGVGTEDPELREVSHLVEGPRLDYGDLMTIYDPTWLAYLWPKLRNGVHFRTGDTCWRDVTQLLQDMQDGRAWALSAVDSTGRFASGLLWGNRYWLGSKTECQDLNMRYSDLKSNGSSSAMSHMRFVNLLNHSYEREADLQKRKKINPELLTQMILFDNTPPFPMTFSVVNFYLNITKATLFSSHSIIIGICLPKSCNRWDVHDLIDFSVKTYQNLRALGTLPRSIKIKAIRQLRDDIDIFNSRKFLAFCSVMTVVLVLIMIGTVLDLYESYLDNLEGSVIPDPAPSFKSFLKIEPVDTQCMDRQSPEYSNVHFESKHVVNVQFKSPEPPHSFDTLTSKKYKESMVDYKENKFPKGTKSNLSGYMSDEVIGYPSSTLSSVVTCGRRESTLMTALFACSIRSNLRKVFSSDVTEDTLAPVHGLRVIITLWTIFVHTCLAAFQFSGNRLFMAKGLNTFDGQIVNKGIYLVDTFFVLNGLSVSYLYVQMIKNGMSHFDGLLGKFSQTVAIFSCRYLRFMPSFLFVTCLYEMILKYHHQYSVLLPPGGEDLTCERYWWRNALYTNGFYNIKQSCMPWTMYLGDETVFYVIGTILMIITMKHFKTGMVLFLMLFLFSWTLEMFVHDKIEIMIDRSYFDLFGDKRWSHTGPYLVGLLSGWFLSKTNCCLLMSKSVLITLWSLSVCIIAFILFDLYESVFGTYGANIYLIFSHTIWSSAVAWILIACITGYGGTLNNFLSYHYWYPFSRLTYTVYLIHPLIIYNILISSNFIQNINFEIIVILFFGFSIISFMTALILSLVLEAPIIAMLKSIHPMKLRPPEIKETYT